jgi:TRAP-type mannitol/chloroaromatic compound transport system permease small subunit
MAISVLIIWFSLHYVEQSYVISEQSQDPGGLPYRFLLKGLIPVGFALLLAQSLAAALGSIDKLRRR